MKVVVAATIGRTISMFLRDQIDLLGQHGHAVTVLCAESEPTRDLCGVTAVEAPWSRPLPAWRWPATLWATRRILATTQPDVLYTHTAIASFVTRLAALSTRPRPSVVYCAHGFDGAAAQPLVRRYMARSAERLLAPWTDVLLVMNDEDEEWAADVFRRVVRIPSVGLPLDRYADTSPRPQGPYRLLVIAELARRKRVHIALDALALLDDRFTLVVLGDGPLRAKYEAQVASLGIAGRVEFAGHVGDVRPYLDRAWAVVSTSRQEGLPRGLLEALATGVPVVGLEARGVDDLLAAGGGVLIPGDDSAELATAIRTLAADPARWLELRSAGLATARLHDSHAIAARVVSEIDKVRSRPVGGISQPG